MAINHSFLQSRVNLQNYSIIHIVEMLPDGWEERNTEDGETFYVDHANQKTQWEKPLKNASGIQVLMYISDSLYYI